MLRGSQNAIQLNILYSTLQYVQSHVQIFAAVANNDGEGIRYFENNLFAM